MEIKNIDTIYNQLKTIIPNDDTHILILRCPDKRKRKYIIALAKDKGLQHALCNTNKFPVNKTSYKCTICKKIYKRKDLISDDDDAGQVFEYYLKCCYDDDAEPMSLLYCENNYKIINCDNFEIIKDNPNSIILSYKAPIQNIEILNSYIQNYKNGKIINKSRYQSGINSLKGLKYYITTIDKINQFIVY